jgi:DNA-binding response OmpR family regulator
VDFELHVLLVEDDDVTRELLARVLNQAGYQVQTAADGACAIRLIEEHAFDIVVSDIRMREVDGIAVLNAARQRRQPAEVILLTGYGSLDTALAALRAGAFNYLLKPCASTELLECVAAAAQRRVAARRRLAATRLLAQDLESVAAAPVLLGPDIPVAALPARDLPGSTPSDTRFLHIGELLLDLFRHTASFAGEQLHLTRTEFTLLCCLGETPGRVLTCSEIVRRTHGYETPDSEAQVLLRTHVRNLRRKIAPDYLVTVRSTGYMLVVPSEAREDAPEV